MQSPSANEHVARYKKALNELRALNAEREQLQQQLAALQEEDGDKH